MSEDYNLKTSEQGIGQLYPVLVDKNGNVIDGFHRLADNPEWRKEKLEHIDSEEKLLVARAVSNWHRRQVSREEKAEWINGLAEIYLKQGYKVGENRRESNEIVSKIAEVTGLTSQTVRIYLSKEFRQTPPKNIEDLNVPKIPASERIEHELGEEYVERHRKEVLEQETPKIREQTKKELLKDPDFQERVIEEIRKDPNYLPEQDFTEEEIMYPQPQIVKPSEACPSGVCNLPNVIEGTGPIDVVKERVNQFFIDNPNCQCKTCPHYKTCGVIR